MHRPFEGATAATISAHYGRNARFTDVTNCLAEAARLDEDERPRKAPLEVVVQLEKLGLVGNCQISALVSSRGEIAWCCLPRFDSEPVFGKLLDEDGGVCSVAPADGSEGVQRYLPNTNVLETRFTTREGIFRVLDFAPRFIQADRPFKPTALCRIIEPIVGLPRVTVECSPRLGWSKERAQAVHGPGFVDFHGFSGPCRLTTDVPLSCLDSGQPFAVTGRHYMAFAWGAPFQEDLEPLCERFLEQTQRYWRRWVKHCNVPPLHQAEVIRSALALKLHCFEDTGAIVAAMTTSIPESPGSRRTWDYRHCRLRDAYYVLSALRQIGHFEERERFVVYLLGIAANHPTLQLAPLYRIDGKSDLDERIVENWAGYGDGAPVRVGTGAASHAQHDIFGELVLALTPVFVDERFEAERSDETLDVLCRLAHKASQLAGTPDAGIWEHRTESRPQTFSSVMCWAAADRVARITAKHRPAAAEEFATIARTIREEILSKAVDPQTESFVSSYGKKELDASLLQLPAVGFLPATDKRIANTIHAVRRELLRDGWMMRYTSDPLGDLSVTQCTFWLVEALARVGNKTAAREVFEDALRSLSPLGLISEDYDPRRARMTGNFPHAYSHVGVIHAAFAASPTWSEVL